MKPYGFFSSLLIRDCKSLQKTIFVSCYNTYILLPLKKDCSAIKNNYIENCFDFYIAEICPFVDLAFECGNTWKASWCSEYTNVFETCPIMCGECTGKIRFTFVLYYRSIRQETTQKPKMSPVFQGL